MSWKGDLTSAEMDFSRMWKLRSGVTSSENLRGHGTHIDPVAFLRREAGRDPAARGRDRAARGRD